MKTLFRLLGLVIALDGLFSAAFGHAFLRFLRRWLPPQVHFALDVFERVPQPLFRAGAIFQAAAGAHLVYHGSPRIKRKPEVP